MREEAPSDTWDSKPGDQFALDADVTLYWPWVRPCWEDPARLADTMAMTRI